MLLKIGSRGDEVKQVQAKLGVVSDGIFGPNTEAMVKSWQSENGLMNDGIVDDNTWFKMLGAVCTSVDSGFLSKTLNSPAEINKLKEILPDNVFSMLENIMPGSELTSALRLAHFMAQCHHESDYFKLVTENLNYHAQRLLAIFPKYFNTTLAVQYEKQPELIASKVYANRMGNGDEATRDGFIYRGRGYIQLTGKDNYRSFAKFIGEDTVTNPELVATKHPLASAYYFFSVNKIWLLCDHGASPSVVSTITKKINGGTTGLEARIKYFNDYYALLMNFD